MGAANAASAAVAILAQATIFLNCFGLSQDGSFLFDPIWVEFLAHALMPLLLKTALDVRRLARMSTSCFLL